MEWRHGSVLGDGHQWRNTVVRTYNYQTKHQASQAYIRTRKKGTVYIDKDITLVDGDSKRIRLSYLMTD